MKAENRFIVESLIQIAKTTSDYEFRERVLTEAYDCLTDQYDHPDGCVVEDDIAQYAKKRLITVGRTDRLTVYGDYIKWCGFSIQPVSKTRFYKALKDLGIGAQRTANGRYICASFYES